MFLIARQAGIFLRMSEKVHLWDGLLQVLCSSRPKREDGGRGREICTPAQMMAGDPSSRWVIKGEEDGRTDSLTR
jgi:hypothetical protein